MCDPYLHLKLAFILSGASKEDYITFFCGINNPDCFNRNDFNIIKKYLNNEYYDLWEYLYKNYSVRQIRFDKNLFSSDETDVNTLENVLNYFEDDNFKLLKDKIKNVNISFINTDILDLKSNLKYKYDLIYLSNIAQYLSSIFGEDISMSSLLKEYKNIIYGLDDNLSFRGKIMAAYIYQINCSNTKYAIKCNSLRKKIFIDDFYYLYFRSLASYKRITLNKENDDGVLMYRKRNLQK